MSPAISLIEQHQMRSNVHTLAKLAMLLCPLLALSKEPEAISPSEILRVKEVFRQVAERFNALPERPNLSVKLLPEEIDVDTSRRAEGGQITAGASRDLVIRLDRKTFRLMFVKNDRLSLAARDKRHELTRIKRGNGLREKSHYHDRLPMDLTFTSAVAKARDYLALFGIEIPSEYRLSLVDFGRKVPERWIVEWTTYPKGIAFDDFIVSAPCISVCFDETQGLESFDRTFEAPPPNAAKIKVTREEAVRKALAVAQFVEKSPHYLRHREPGFVPCAIREVKLAVAVPNWLLDPKRAIWLRDKPPEETRLCWLVQILTRAGTEDLAKRRLLPPQVTIMIDAATGETVGANFS